MLTITLQAAFSLRMGMVLLNLIFGIIWMILPACLIPPTLIGCHLPRSFPQWGCGSRANQPTLPVVFRSFCFQPVYRYWQRLSLSVFPAKRGLRWFLDCYLLSRFITRPLCPFPITTRCLCCLVGRSCSLCRVAKNGFLLDWER